MNIFNNEYLIQNISDVTSIITAAFLIAFFVTPLVGLLARKLKAVDLPASMRSRGERGIDTRIHAYPYPKLGGLAVVIAFISILSINHFIEIIPTGILLGIFVIVILGVVDDIFEVSAPVQFGMQFLAAFLFILSGMSISSINLFGFVLDFNWLPEIIIQLGSFTYNFIFPGDLITILWIVGVINVINWVGGVDALNATISSIAFLTMLILVLSSGNIPLALIMAAYLGSILGVLPFNWNPGKIMYGSVGDYLNGYLLAVFAIVGGLKWNATLIVLALPIIDGLIVFINRWKNNPELRSKPFKLMGLSGYNHLHHRILSAGFSKKMVVLIEGTIMIVVCSIVLLFSDLENEYLAVVIVLAIFTVIFALLTVQVKKAERKKQLILAAQLEEEERKKDVFVNVVQEGEDNEGEKFVY